VVISVKLRGRTRGAIFVDAMLGIYILALLGLMFAATTMAALVSRTMADERTKATSIVNRQLESIKAIGYGNLTYSALYYYGLIESSPTSSPFSFTSAGSTTDRVSELLPSGTGTVAVTDASSTMRLVTVTVNWDSRTGTRTVSASTNLAKLK